MIIDWREKLADKELPFFIVQLANFMKTHSEPVEVIGRLCVKRNGK